MPPDALNDQAGRAACARPVQDLCETVRQEGLFGNRGLIAALLLSTLHGYRFGPSWREDRATRFFRVLVALFLVISGLAWVLLSSGLRGIYRPTINTDVAFYATTVVGVVCLLSIRLLWTFSGSIGFLKKQVRRGEKPSIAAFCLGKIDHVLDPRNLRLVVFSFLFLLVMQVTLLSFTRDHCGIDFDGGFRTSLLLTLDNLFHGVLLDVCELYGLNLASSVEHTYWSASFFLFFRLGYEAMLLLFVYLAWQRWTARRLFAPLPGNSAELIRWLQTGLDRRWFRRFPCEYTFLVLVREYLAGQDDVVRTIGRRFDDLGISGEVRALFVDAGGRALLPDPKAKTPSGEALPQGNTPSGSDRGP